MKLEEIKEAVEVIKAYRQMLTDSVSNQVDGDIKAFDVAVEAMERESSSDAISRQAVLEIVEREQNKGDALSEIEKLSLVNPQRTGHWIATEETEGLGNCKCSVCDHYYYTSGKMLWNYCPNCGAKMIEPQAEGEEA
jgi:hypothetical protein